MTEEKTNAAPLPTAKNDDSIKTEGQESATGQEQKESEGGGLTSPEGILMLCVAGILDGIGLMLFLLSWLGIDDFGILDIFGMIIIGGWMFIRGQGLNKNIMQKGLRRFAVASAVELVPFLGGIAPSWTILVYKEFKN